VEYQVVKCKDQVCILHASDVNDTVIVTHDAKAAALHGFYSNLLGHASTDRWDFDIVSLYAGCPQVDGAALIGPFSTREIKGTVNAMDRTSAPGPDGLGMSFYREA
jgi:hypothetical protein